MAGTQAILIVSDDGSQAFAYACNSVHSSDWWSGTFRDTILDLMDDIDDDDAWPSIDLFGKYNPEYDAWAAAEFASAIGRTGLIELWAPNADPDNDGRNNALEAYLGSDPLTANSSPFSVHYTNGELVLRWSKKNGYRGVEAAAEWSAAVSPWVGNPASIVNRTDLITQLGYTIQEAQVAIPRGVSQRFLQLNVTTP
jgi:hypothetical protein